MGDQLKMQLGNDKALYIASGILIVMGLVPGMPKIAFLGLGILIGGIAYWNKRLITKRKNEEAKESAT